MSLTTVCTHCGTRQPLAAGLADDDGKRFGVAMGELPPAIARAAVGYLALFKPAKTELRTSRATKLVAELAALVNAGTVCRDERSGVRRPAAAAVWVAGIEQLLAAPPSGLPLGNHNYLRVIVYDLADKADATVERAREVELRTTRQRSGVSPEAAPEDKLKNQLAWLAQQLDYGAITPEAYEQRVAEARKAAA